MLVLLIFQTKFFARVSRKDSNSPSWWSVGNMLGAEITEEKCVGIN